MNAADTKRLIRLGAVCVAVLLVAGATILFVWRAPHIAGRATASPLPINYTRNICDDAYETEKNYAKVNPPYIDVPLQDGCFSGFIHLPEKWNSWQVQFRPGGVWMAEWYGGWNNPAGPFTADQVSAAQLPGGTMPSREVRYQGKGTLRIYRLTGDMSNTTAPGDLARAQPAAPAHDPAPTLPDLGASKDYRFVLEQCSRSGEKIECWGYMTNETDTTANVWLHQMRATDDEGHLFAAESLRTNLSDEKLLPGVKVRWTAVFPDGHMNASAFTPLQLKVHFEEDGGRLLDNDDVVFKNACFGKCR